MALLSSVASVGGAVRSTVRRLYQAWAGGTVPIENPPTPTPTGLKTSSQPTFVRAARRQPYTAWAGPSVEVTPTTFADIGWLPTPPQPVRAEKRLGAAFIQARPFSPWDLDITQAMYETYWPPLQVRQRPLGPQPGQPFLGPPPAPDTSPVYWSPIYPGFITPERRLHVSSQRAFHWHVDTTPSPVPPADSWFPTVSDFGPRRGGLPTAAQMVYTGILDPIPNLQPGEVRGGIRYYYKHHF